MSCPRSHTVDWHGFIRHAHQVLQEGIAKVLRLKRAFAGEAGGHLGARVHLAGLELQARTWRASWTLSRAVQH